MRKNRIVLTRPVPQQKLLTQKALAAYLGVDRISVWYWHNRQGNGPPRILVGKRYYYSAEAVLAWLRDNGA